MTLVEKIKYYYRNKQKYDYMKLQHDFKKYKKCKCGDCKNYHIKKGMCKRHLVFVGKNDGARCWKA